MLSFIKPYVFLGPWLAKHKYQRFKSNPSVPKNIAISTTKNSVTHADRIFGAGIDVETESCSILLLILTNSNAGSAVVDQPLERKMIIRPALCCSHMSALDVELKWVG